MSAPTEAASSAAAAGTYPLKTTDRERADDIFDSFDGADDESVRRWTKKAQHLSDRSIKVAIIASSAANRAQMESTITSAAELDAIHAICHAELDRRALLLKPLPGGLPHFPVQPWERAMRTWMEQQDLAHQHPYMTFEQLVQMYEASQPVRHPEARTRVDKEHPNALLTAPERHANAVGVAAVQVGGPRSAMRLLERYLADGHGPGTPLWHYTVERMKYTLLAGLRSVATPDRRRVDYTEPREVRDAWHLAMHDIYKALVAEETRRALARTHVRERMYVAESGIVDHMMSLNPDGFQRGGMHPAQLVGQYASGRITGRPIPGLAHSGPVRSNIDVLRVIAEQAAAAAAQGPVGAVAALADMAHRLTGLSESVAKRARQ